MKTHLTIILLALFGFFIFASPIGFAEESQETRLTPFDVFLSESDFTAQGPNHYILVLNKGNSTEINVYVKNNDDVPHKVKLSSPRNSDSSTFSQFEFEPKEILVLPNKTNSTKLYLTISNQTTTHSTFVTFLGQSETFGMKGLGFYVVVDGDFQWVDYSLRAGLPGSAFPNLATNISEKEAEKLIKNGLGIPDYLPNGYQFRGVMDGDESQLFVYSNSNVSNQTESIEFSQEGGITIFYNVKGPNVNNTKSLPFKVAQDEGQQILINGFSGMVTEQTSRTVMYSNSTYEVPADLYFFDDDKKLSVSVKGNLPLDEILKIAESITVETRHPCINNENLPGVCTPEKSLEFYEFMGNQWMESKKQEMLDAMREDRFQDWIDQTDNHYHWNVYQYYSFTEDLAGVRLYQSPHKQDSEGVDSDKIQCNFNLLILQKYDGSPACVKPETKQRLIERGWTGIDNNTKFLLERYGNLPEVIAFYETYEDAQVSIKNDQVSYFSGSDDGYFARMNLFFDENYSVKNIDFHCYFQRTHQYEFPQEDIASKITNFDCKEYGKTVEPESNRNSIPKWKIPEELSKLGCSDAMVDHLKKYSNAFDEKWYGGGVAIEDIGLPWGVHQYALDQCMQNISELRDSEMYGCEENEVYFHGICMTPETKEKAQSVGEKENEN